jgi:hypothetical protein
MTEDGINNIDYILWSVEDIQDNISEKLAKMFSFYNEQEFLDEINWVEPCYNTVEIDVED